MEKRYLPGKKTAIAAFSFLIFLAGLVPSYLLARLHHSALVGNERSHISVHLDKVRGDINRQLDAVIYLPKGLVSLVKTQQGIVKKQFDSISKEIISSEPRIRNIALAQDTVIRHVYPNKGNEAALGVNYLDIPDQREAVLQAIREKTTVVAGPVNLMQGGVGIISRTPIFVRDPEDEKKRVYWGTASVVIDFDTFIGSIGLGDAGNKELDFALRGVDGAGPRGKTFWGDETIFKKDPVIMDIALPSGTWQIAAMPAGGWSRFNPLKSAYFHFGWVLSLLVSILFFQLAKMNIALRGQVSERMVADEAIRQKNRALEMLSSCNSAVVRANNEQALFDAVCTIAVESAGYRLAWIGRAENDAGKTVRPIAFCGSGEGFLDNIRVSWADDEFGRGSAGRAIRTQKPCVIHDLLNNPDFTPWHEFFVDRDYQSAMAIPLIPGIEVFGALVVYAAEPEAFDSTEIALLDELGKNISYAIKALRAHRERERAMAALEQSRAELEMRVEERTMELRLAKEAAESADRLKSAFLATMSHELRTPLNSIIGFTGIMLQGIVGELNEEQQKQLKMVSNSAHHLLDLITDVLDISKIEAGQLEIRREPFVLEQAIEKSLQVIIPLAEKKSLAIKNAIRGDLGTICSDRRRVEQVLINILSNAVKFTEHGHIEVSAEIIPNGAAENGNSQGSRVRIAVADTGIGMSPEDMEKIFKPFQQVDTGTTRRYEGTGLGLSICKKLASLLGGDIYAASGGPGRGSVFTFILPKGGDSHG